MQTRRGFRIMANLRFRVFGLGQPTAGRACPRSAVGCRALVVSAHGLRAKNAMSRALRTSVYGPLTL